MGLSLVEKQLAFCKENEYECDVIQEDSIVGYAIETQGGVPVNGLRHPQHGDTSGWYIWCGTDYSEEAEFFKPLHAIHLDERCPEITKLLGLPPGYRFLIAGEYLDIWYDESLLTLNEG